jgi:hypothetical protein
MSRLGALFGFLCGIGAGILLLLHNPIVQPGMDVPMGSRILRWNALEHFGISFSAADMLGLSDGGGQHSVGVAEIDLASASILLLRNSAGQPAALATRLSAVNDNRDLLAGRVGVDTYTNIFWPNRGSVFSHGYENRWPVISGNALVALNQASVPPDGYFVSAQHPDKMQTGIVGGSGLLTGLSGRYGERLKPDSDNQGLYMGTIWFERSVE